MTIKKGAFRPASAMDKRRAAPVVGGRDAPKNRKRFASRPAGFGSYPAQPPIHAFAPLILRRGKGAPLTSDAALIQMEDVTMTTLEKIEIQLERFGFSRSNVITDSVAMILLTEERFLFDGPDRVQIKPADAVAAARWVAAKATELADALQSQHGGG
ncbi:MAG: hypothetical protein LDL39_11555 [Magnetospirillum sp.]|nr:hypothetical protein [Magnetospirillum sp.]